MKEKFLKVAQQGHFFEHHQKVLVAVSTGHDSMALLDCLLIYQKELAIEIGIVHVNHKQRKESEQEEEFIRKFAEKRKIPLFVAYYPFSHFSETKAREFRYDFFKETMKNQGYTALVTAHHADDQVETMLMRIIRGSRLRHLKGIQAVTPFGSGELIRPFLSFQKNELNVEEFFEDSSNFSTKYFRNRVRNTYLPLFEKENPQIKSALLTLNKDIAFLYDALEELVNPIDVTNVDIFTSYSLSVQYVLLQQYLSKFPDLELTRSQFEQLLHIINHQANHQSHLKNGYYFLKSYEHFLITKIIPQTDSSHQEYVIKSDGIIECSNFIFSLNKEIPSSQKLFVKANIPILIRKRKPGDRILINGVQKKVRRYFIDQKIPLATRNQPIIIEQDKKILGILNIAASDLSKSLKNDIMSDILYIKMKEQ